MEISRNSWHARVYAWWYSNKYGRSPATSNLCPYMRVILIWAPIRFLFWSWIKIPITLEWDQERYKIPLNVITIPIITYATPMLIGYFSYAIKKSLLILYLILTAAGLFILGLIFVFMVCEETNFEGAKDFLHRNTVDSSFGSLIVRYLRSFHDGVCPTIDLK